MPILHPRADRGRAACANVSLGLALIGWLGAGWAPSAPGADVITPQRALVGRVPGGNVSVETVEAGAQQPPRITGEAALLGRGNSRIRFTLSSDGALPSGDGARALLNHVRSAKTLGGV